MHLILSIHIYIYINVYTCEKAELQTSKKYPIYEIALKSVCALNSCCILPRLIELSFHELNSEALLTTIKPKKVKALVYYNYYIKDSSNRI